MNADPSIMLDVSRKGLSVPLTSWWSLLITTLPDNSPLFTAWLNLLASAALPVISEYRILALIRRILRDSAKIYFT